MAKKTSPPKEQAYREAFLAHLTRKLAAPKTEWPTVRCWTKQSLNQVFRQVRDALAGEGIETNLTHRSLLEWITRLGLAHSPSVEGESFYLLEIGASGETEVDALELLLAAKPSGVVCYFSAVVFHSLTTQPAEHHHVAELRPQSPRRQSEHVTGETPERIEEATVSRKPKPRGFGTLLFRYQGIPYYSTRRTVRLIPGVQTRGYGPRTQIRITTLEQTLLDTLYKPFHSGGPQVVFEAWEEGVASGRVDEERLVEYLREMNYPATARRLGVMLEVVGYTPGNELKRLLDDHRDAIDRQNPFARISLLPGVDYQNLNGPWLVSTP